MAVHVFSVTEKNYEICIQRGLVGLPEPGEGRNKNITFDGLLSRLAAIRKNDFILMYVVKAKELRGLWQAEGEPFYDETPVWTDRIYPFRCKIKCAECSFQNSLKLNDINDLCSSGKIWTWAFLRRNSGANAMFSISNQEFGVLLNEYMKINPFTLSQKIIREPYPFHDSNLMEKIHFSGGQPKYEYSVMALLNRAFAKEKHTDIFGNYTDHLCYVPTNLGKEIDILLMFGDPSEKTRVTSYDIIEVKHEKFKESALEQLIGYESWFLQKKVSGDLNMIRTTAIARSFSDVVIDYVEKRKKFENKPIKLLTYDYNAGNGQLELHRVL